MMQQFTMSSSSTIQDAHHIAIFIFQRLYITFLSRPCPQLKQQTQIYLRKGLNGTLKVTLLVQTLPME